MRILLLRYLFSLAFALPPLRFFHVVHVEDGLFVCIDHRRRGRMERRKRRWRRVGREIGLPRWTQRGLGQLTSCAVVPLSCLMRCPTRIRHGHPGDGREIAFSFPVIPEGRRGRIACQMGFHDGDRQTSSFPTKGDRRRRYYPHFQWDGGQTSCRTGWKWRRIRRKTRKQKRRTRGVGDRFSGWEMPVRGWTRGCPWWRGGHLPSEMFLPVVLVLVFSSFL